MPPPPPVCPSVFPVPPFPKLPIWKIEGLRLED